MRPAREHATNNRQTYFVTSNCHERWPLFRRPRWAELFIDTLLSYRPERYLLHGFVVMPDHFHLLMTPAGSLERAVQCVKGGFSFRAKRELGWPHPVWLAGFSDHRIRDAADLDTHCRYIARNPFKAGLAAREGEYPYSSENRAFALDPVPQGLKPYNSAAASGAAKAAPFQSASRTGKRDISLETERDPEPYKGVAAGAETA